MRKLLERWSTRFDQVSKLAGTPGGSRFNVHATSRAAVFGDQHRCSPVAVDRFAKRAGTKLGLRRQQEVAELLINEEDHRTLTQWPRSVARLRAR